MLLIMGSLANKRNGYVPISNRQRALAVGAIALLYLLACLALLNWSRRPPEPPALAEPNAVKLIPLQAPVEPAAPPTQEPSANVREANASGSSAPSVKVDPRPPVPLIAPPVLSRIEFAPVVNAPPAPPLPPVETGGIATREGIGTNAEGSGTGSGSGGGSGSGTGGNGGAPPIRAVWARQATWEEIHPFHPQRAKLANVSGSAMLVCRATLKQRLKECRVIGETPAGWNFGRAALDLAPRLRVRPRRENGVEIDNGLVSFTIRFDLPIETPR